MTLPSEVNALLLGTGTEYQIARSLRSRAGASPTFSRTLAASSTSSTTCTWSLWVKRGTLGVSRAVVAYNGNTAGTSNIIIIEFVSDTIRVAFDGGLTTMIQTSAVYRDPSAWYHLVLTYDSTQATASNRARLFVNGVQVTSFTTAAYPALNQAFNAAAGNVQNLINVAGLIFDGYLAEINFIDGQALTPSSFGYTDPKTGVWMPKAYMGTYGTNGFYLKFTDNSGATATTIGRDFSGNGNNFTPTNISVTAGVTNDSMIDSPTNYADGGNGRGNYATWFPQQGGQTWSFTEGNLRAVNANIGTAAYSCIATIAVSVGKWYWEVQSLAGGPTTSRVPGVGIIDPTRNLLLSTATVRPDIYLSGNGTIDDLNGSALQSGFANMAANDIVGVAVDADAKTVQFYRNGSAVGTAQSYSPAYVAPSAYSYSGYPFIANFGQRPFVYTPPAGFRALNTQNLPTTSIQNGAIAFDAVTYTGTGATLSVGTESFSPDFVWIKSRSAATDHGLYDTARGPQLQLESNTTTAETNEPTGLTAFTSNGFTTGSLAQLNTNAATYVAWMWDEAPADGFDIVTYVGTGSALNVSHNLGVVPRFMIIKARNNTAADHWGVYHGSLLNTQNLYLNLTNAVATAGMWNSTTPTSSVFTVGANNDVNRSGLSYVGYVWAEVPGFSAFRSYVGNGSTDGPFVFCGFRPRFLLIKDATNVTWWVMVDTVRNTFNPITDELLPNNSVAENGLAITTSIDVTANGFKIRTADANLNNSGDTFVFAAFAENPFKIARAR